MRHIYANFFFFFVHDYHGDDKQAIVDRIIMMMIGEMIIFGAAPF